MSTLEKATRLAGEIASNVSFYAEHNMMPKEQDELFAKGRRYKQLIDEMCAEHEEYMKTRRPV